MSHAEKKMLRMIDPAKCKVKGHAYSYEDRPRPGERCACGTTIECTACGEKHVVVMAEGCRVCVAQKRRERKAARA